jgi:hypothetical protein
MKAMTTTMLLLAACGSGVRSKPEQVGGTDAQVPCNTQIGATMTGTIEGQPYPAIHGVFGVAASSAGDGGPTDAYMILLSQSETFPPDANSIGIVFCGPNEPALGTYPNLDAATFACPGSTGHVTAQAAVGDHADNAIGGGSVTITEQDDCIAGTFTIPFSATDTITGTFNGVTFVR